MTIDEQRKLVVDETFKWLGTPYHPNARVLGAGVDCATLLAEVYPTALGWEPITLPHYSSQWHLHHSEEMYLAAVDKVVGVYGGGEVPNVTGPGDVVVWKIGRTFSHGAIVIKWPCVIHASLQARCVEMVNDVMLHGEVMGREMKVFSPWA